MTASPCPSGVKPAFRVVLHEPEIPNNTGNIGRTCVGTGSELHLIEPLGFEISDKQLRRAGLDYWPHLTWQTHKSWQQWLAQVEDPSRLVLFTTKTERSLFEYQFQSGDWLVFGKETQGLPQQIREQFANQCVTLPMYGPIRSLNLANAVAVALYEGMRQINQ